MSAGKVKYQVFISSTFNDLTAERESATWTVLKMRHIPVGMEAFPATDERGWKTIQALIDETDYYVVLVAGRYGSLDPETGLSWTEREYRYALEKQVPVLAFIRRDNAITMDRVDTGDLAERLAAFKGDLRLRHLAKEWSSADELCGLIRDAVYNHVVDDQHTGNPRPGWYRGTPLSVESFDEFARLSKENAEMRDKLRALDARKADLHFVRENGESPCGVLFAFESGIHLIVPSGLMNTGNATAPRATVEMRFGPVIGGLYEADGWDNIPCSEAGIFIFRVVVPDVFPGSFTRCPSLSVRFTNDQPGGRIPFHVRITSDFGTQGEESGEIVVAR